MRHYGIVDLKEQSFACELTRHHLLGFPRTLKIQRIVHRRCRLLSRLLRNSSSVSPKAQVFKLPNTTAPRRRVAVVSGRKQQDWTYMRCNIVATLGEHVSSSEQGITRCCWLLITRATVDSSVESSKPSGGRSI